MPSSFFAQCSQVWFVFIKTEHSQSFKKRPWMSIFDDCRIKFAFYFWLLAFNLCTAISEAWIPKNDCRHFMHSSLFHQVFSILIFTKYKKGHFVSFLERALNAMRVKCVCKSCIREHSDKRVLDHNRNLQSPI